MNSFQPLIPVFFSAEVQGIVTKTISAKQKGQVKYQASYWMAQLFDTEQKTFLRVGWDVQIVGRIGNTLLVTKT